MRSREQNYEEWEQNTSYFYNRIKINQQKQTFTSILDPNNTEKYGMDMVDEIKSFYTKLCQSEIKDDHYKECIEQTEGVPKLSLEEKEKCE